MSFVQGLQLVMDFSIAPFKYGKRDCFTFSKNVFEVAHDTKIKLIDDMEYRSVADIKHIMRAYGTTCYYDTLMQIFAMNGMIKVPGPSDFVFVVGRFGQRKRVFSGVYFFKFVYTPSLQGIARIPLESVVSPEFFKLEGR